MVLTAMGKNPHVKSITWSRMWPDMVLILIYFIEPLMDIYLGYLFTLSQIFKRLICNVYMLSNYKRCHSIVIMLIGFRIKLLPMGILTLMLWKLN